MKTESTENRKIMLDEILVLFLRRGHVIQPQGFGEH